MINKTKSILKSNFPIILASNSESRLRILQETGIDFIQLKSDIDELNEKIIVIKKEQDL